jgi:ABC-type Zn2+ transport system substrate-binding protein/surface adhesin
MISGVALPHQTLSSASEREIERAKEIEKAREREGERESEHDRDRERARERDSERDSEHERERDREDPCAHHRHQACKHMQSAGPRLWGYNPV